MINTILKFEKDEIVNYDGSGDSFIFRSFTDRHYEFPSEYYKEKYYDNILVEDDERIELLAYKYYGQTKFWDLIMIYNKMDSPMLLPKNYDFVYDRGEIRYNEWFNYYGDNKPLWFLENKKRWFIQVSAKENEIYRNIKLIKKNYINKIMKELDDGFRISG